MRGLGLGIQGLLKPEYPTFLRTFYKEIIIRNPEKVGFLGVKVGFMLFRALRFEARGQGL